MTEQKVSAAYEFKPENYATRTKSLYDNWKVFCSPSQMFQRTDVRQE